MRAAPRIRDGLAWVAADRGVVVDGGRRRQLLEDRRDHSVPDRNLFARVLEFADGTRDIAELAETLDEPGDLVRDAAAVLEERGIVDMIAARQRRPRPTQTEAFMARCRVSADVGRVRELMTHSEVRVVGRGTIARRLRDLLRTAGFTLRLAGHGAPGSGPRRAHAGTRRLTIVVAEPSRGRGGEPAAKVAARSGTPWLRVCASATRFQIGPLFGAARASCYPCFRASREFWLPTRPYVRTGLSEVVAALAAGAASQYLLGDEPEWMHGGLLDTRLDEGLAQRPVVVPCRRDCACWAHPDAVLAVPPSAGGSPRQVPAGPPAPADLCESQPRKRYLTCPYFSLHGRSVVIGTANGRRLRSLGEAHRNVIALWSILGQAADVRPRRLSSRKAPGPAPPTAGLVSSAQICVAGNLFGLGAGATFYFDPVQQSLAQLTGGAPESARAPASPGIIHIAVVTGVAGPRPVVAPGQEAAAVLARIAWNSAQHGWLAELVPPCAPHVSEGRFDLDPDGEAIAAMVRLHPPRKAAAGTGELAVPGPESVSGRDIEAVMKRANDVHRSFWPGGAAAAGTIGQLVLARRVDGLDAGMYVFDPGSRRLRVCGPVPPAPDDGAGRPREPGGRAASRTTFIIYRPPRAAGGARDVADVMNDPVSECVAMANLAGLAAAARGIAGTTLLTGNQPDGAGVSPA